MSPKDVIQTLTALIQTREPIFIWGPPGVGKSDITKQVAKSQDMQLIDLRGPLLDPTDIHGLPFINGGGRAHWAKPSFLPHDMDSRGILFLDELPSAVSLVQTAFLQLTLDRRIHDYLLPEGWVVVAAGN